MGKGYGGGVMTVDRLRKRGVTVRTLQYYDKEGLLSPTAVRRRAKVYTDKDVVRLHQILSMKSLGFLWMILRTV